MKHCILTTKKGQGIDEIPVTRSLFVTEDPDRPIRIGML